MKKKQSLEDIHSDALKKFNYIQSAVRDERMQCLQDRRFVSIAGAQWEGGLGEQFENRPKLEFNKIALAITRIINEYRNNPVTVDFVSKDGAENDVMADTLDGLYRSDEDYSVASEAYDTAFEEAVTGGFGAFRLRTEYEDEYDPENENQRIRIEPIPDADTSVFFDLNSKRQDKSDATHAFVITAMDRETYEDTYSDDVSSWPKSISQLEFDWSTPDIVYVAEYYVIETVPVTLRIFQTMDGQEEKYWPQDFENDPKLLDTLNAVGTREVRQRKLKQDRVHKYIMSGSKILEDLGYIAGSNIPIIPVYGKRFYIENVERCFGHVRLAKDAQRLKNMQLSKLAEISALSSIEKPLFYPEQVAGHQMQWAEDNIKNYPYLLVNPITGADGSIQSIGPLGYTRPPAVPAALAALLQTTEVDMNDILGNAQQADQMLSGVSGKAIELIQTRVDGQAAIYTSNFAKAMRRAGEVWLDIAREIYSSRTRMKTVGKDGEVSSVEIMKPVLGDNAEVIMENDIANAKFDVMVDVGPSSASKRAATVRSLTNMMQASDDPETRQILSALALSNMEGEGLSDVRGYFRNQLVRKGVIKPSEQEALQLQTEAANAKPNAQDSFLLASAEEANARATKAHADVMKIVSDVQYNNAKTAEIASKIETGDIAKYKALQELTGVKPPEEPKIQQPLA